MVGNGRGEIHEGAGGVEKGERFVREIAGLGKGERFMREVAG